MVVSNKVKEENRRWLEKKLNLLNVQSYKHTRKINYRDILGTLKSLEQVLSTKKGRKIVQKSLTDVEKKIYLESFCSFDL